jgi:hypothetical protein
MHYGFARAAAAAACVALATCSTSQLEKCPAVSVLVDTASMTQLQSNASGPASVVYTAQILNAKRDCDVSKFSKQVQASVDISFRATRAHAEAAASYTVPYFIAITTEGKILAKQQFLVAFAFQRGETTTSFEDSVNSLVLTVGRDKKATDYGILIGFQLTKAQLDYNRRVGRYAK